MNTTIKSISLVGLFALAMGFLEAVVVIYLREIYYPNGFQFPLKPMDSSLAKIEILRELATLVMLIVVGYLAGKTKLQRFAFFSLAFAVWDLFYYVFLWIFVDWPQSLFTWDILFLIPLPWIGPVWAPCLLAFLMLFGSSLVIQQTNRSPNFYVKKSHWLILITGALLCIISFQWDYLVFCNSADIWSLNSSNALFSEIHSYVPESFNSFLFFLGFAAMSFPVFSHLILTYKSKTK